MYCPTLLAFRPRALAVGAAALLTIACSDSLIMAPSVVDVPVARDRLVEFDCTATVRNPTVTCKETGTAGAGQANASIFGRLSVTLTSSAFTYDGGTGDYQFDVTVTNLLNEAIGTPDGTLPDTGGIKVFFHSMPVATAGTGVITVENPDGTETITASNQPFYRYNQILAKDSVSLAKTWLFNVPSTVDAFDFKIYLSSSVQYLLVVNEWLTNAGGTILDANGEWLEIYNAGTREVQMQGLFIADSAASGRRPYNVIASSLIIPSGGYMVLGNTTNTTNNGGVPVDYAYGAQMAFANSLDGFKLSRLYGSDVLGDTLTSPMLTIDAVYFGNASISAQNGISRELINPALNNVNVDGGNWADALVTAVYGPGGRGTPKAQNSTFTP